MSEYRTPPQLPQPAEEKGHAVKIATGCGLGCLAVVVAAGFIAFFLYRSVESKVEEFASYVPAKPLIIEYPEVQAVEAEEVIRRFDDFRSAMTRSRTAAPLILSERDINTLIRYHPDFAALVNRTRVEIRNNTLHGIVSVKAEDLPFRLPLISRALKGKYINGTATVRLGVREGRAEMYLLDFSFGDYAVPEDILDELKKENLLQGAESDPDLKPLIENLDELEIRGNLLHIYPKGTRPDPSEPPLA